LKRWFGIEVQFGKYAFKVYNVCAKMTIFHKLGHINAGIEIVPIKRFADQMVVPFNIGTGECLVGLTCWSAGGAATPPYRVCMSKSS
jgi:hypothetical protein